jgi:5-methylcytosine-specific restriction endonuclease McrA
MDRTPETFFALRTRTCFHNQQRRAREAGQPLDYSLDQLRVLVGTTLGRPCRYCGDKLDPANWSLDHQTPTSRGGSFTLANLAVICEPCNRVKGVLDAQEYARLWEVIRSWPKRSRSNLLARLRAGATVARN